MQKLSVHATPNGTETYTQRIQSTPFMQPTCFELVLRFILETHSCQLAHDGPTVQLVQWGTFGEVVLDILKVVLGQRINFTHGSD